MSKPALRTPDFGAFLKELRETRGRKLQGVVNQLEGLGIEIDQSALHKYESGRVPPIHVLSGLAAVLHHPLPDLCYRLLRELGVKKLQFIGGALGLSPEEKVSNKDPFLVDPAVSPETQSATSPTPSEVGTEAAQGGTHEIDALGAETGGSASPRVVRSHPRNWQQLAADAQVLVGTIDNLTNQRGILLDVIDALARRHTSTARRQSTRTSRDSSGHRRRPPRGGKR